MNKFINDDAKITDFSYPYKQPWLIERYRYKAGRRIMCYIDYVVTPSGFYWDVYTGRPCDPNTIRRRFSSFSRADRYAKTLLGYGTTRLERIYDTAGGGGR